MTLRIVATAGAGSDLQPLISEALALRRRGHDTFFLGDASVEHALLPLGVGVTVLPSELDLGARLSTVARDAMTAAGGARFWRVDKRSR